MRIKISNLGAIEQAEINLKPLTIFVGANSTGKTWTAYTLASIFGQYGFDKYIKAYNKTHIKYELLENAFDTFLQIGSTQIDLIEFANNCADKYINDVSSLAPDWIPEYLNTERANFQNLKLDIELSNSKINIIDKIKNYSLDKHVSFGSQFTVKIIKQQGENDIYFFIIYEGDSKKTPQVLEKVFKEIFSETIFEIIHKCLYSYTYIFPTERTAYTGFPFAFNTKEIKLNIDKLIQDIEQEDISETKVNHNQEKVLIKLIKLRELLNENADEQKTSKDNKPRIKGNAAIQSLIEVIAKASTIEDITRKQQAQENSKIQDYIDLAQALERNILYGNIEIDSSKLQNEIVFHPLNNGASLEMQVSSSMVKELAPLLLCLRYLAEPNDLLIIDEPEMNLHPEAQVHCMYPP
ncbi:hypothetical protein DSM106972_028730 [Dulcicalothrix desertica PCC 7102]|uniref:Endonuclease GajA/Old nuclease/RecF-like AAA domain-containing protein n=1 Tax=Dulcicalothrix desertica PCC 7102 TaxID=232991 RepID=A0A433VKK7_9CYAN|nr:AAA family ATPase [Dulcicalothrix desertica]RUT06616.1 hypothetical protein DSM106972_028730 [Dulcicalothrix desertica PCC 7102]TWH50275.1 AAA ATPase-like protein [Dulcicalothrix desertica PCC 7102]